jgi:hypothetical protein
VLADGVERGILSVNRMIPGPSIQVSLASVTVIICKWVKKLIILADGMESTG